MVNKLFKLFNFLLLNPIFLLLVIGVLIATSVYSYIQYDDAQSQLKKVKVELEELRNSPQATASEIRVLVDQVGRIVALPPNETPTVATITDIEKLKEQPFFANAKNGDKILIYRIARKAYLYRPEDNKIIEVAPINITEEQQPAEAGNEENETNQDENTDENTDGKPTATVTTEPSPTGEPEDSTSNKETTSDGN